VSKFLFAKRHLESRIEPKIAPIGVYITMRALQKPIRYTAHHFEERTAAPPHHRFVAEIETITTFHM
jgi:hypothetical protein